MNKPIKPNITIPQSFAKNGVKTDFDSDLIAEGFDGLKPDVLAGDNLNKFIDDTYQGLNYGMAAADAINLINEGETLTVVDGKLTSGASGGGLEIGDIGIAPLGIDESKGKRRYLNGQLIIQEQYVQFTNKVKSAVALYPSLACTESEWQTTATMTVGGQVGKFVVDDDAGTIRLPKIIMPIQGLTDLSKLGEIVEAGLPNITGTINITGQSSTPTSGTGVFSYSKSGTWASYQTSGNNVYGGLTFDASRSNPIYGNSTTVQQEQIQYPYFIQVATGAEVEDNIINEVELNNPYSYGDSKYSPVALNNLSWLKSEGQWNSKAVYPAYYDWALTNFNNDVEGFALSTGEYTDYDVVINPADETFRLPLLNGSESLPSGKTINLSSSLTSSGQTFIAPANGWYTITMSRYGGETQSFIAISNLTSGMASEPRSYGGSSSSTFGLAGWIYAKRGDIIKVSYSDVYAFRVNDDGFIFTYAQGNGSLYFYVGETVQNANLINAGRIEEKVASLIPDNSSLIAGYAMPSAKYIDLTVGATGTDYTAPANGWFCAAIRLASANGAVGLTNSNGLRVSSTLGGNQTDTICSVSLPVKRGEITDLTYWGHSTGTYERKSLRFIYAEGEQ